MVRRSLELHYYLLTTLLLKSFIINSVTFMNQKRINRVIKFTKPPV